MASDPIGGDGDSSSGSGDGWRPVGRNEYESWGNQTLPESVQKLGISSKGNPCSVGFGLDNTVGMKTFLPDGYWEFGGGLGVIAGVGGGVTQSWGVQVSNGAIVNAYRATNVYGGAGFYGQAGLGAGWSQTGSYNAPGTISAGGIAGLGPWGGAFTGSGPNLRSLSNWGQSHSLGKDGGGGLAAAVIDTVGSCKVG